MVKGLVAGALALVGLSSPAAAATYQFDSTIDLSVTFSPRGAGLVLSLLRDLSATNTVTATPGSSAMISNSHELSGLTYTASTSISAFVTGLGGSATEEPATGQLTALSSVANQNYLRATNTSSQELRFKYWARIETGTANVVYTPDVFVTGRGRDAHFRSVNVSITPSGFPSLTKRSAENTFRNAVTTVNGNINVSLGAGQSIDFAFGSDALLRQTANGVPEPAAWALMIAGFGLVGFFARRKRFTAALS